jgi:hypothetical protein
MKQAIEGIPAGYEMVAYRKAKTGELCLMGDPLEVREWCPDNDSIALHPILKKLSVKMADFPKELYDNHYKSPDAMLLVNGSWVKGYWDQDMEAYRQRGCEYSEPVEPTAWKPVAE